MNPQTGVDFGPPVSGERRAIAARVRWRLVLPCVLFMLLSSLDRANVSFAAVTMNTALQLSAAQYGFAAGIVFVGFLAGQYPSVLLFLRIGMRRWIALCAVLWGASTTAMAFIHSAQELYLLRLILGFAEGGLAPGIVLYLSQFATERERASTFALPMLAIPVSIVIGGPLSGWLLDSPPTDALSGWRWMFLAEGIPTVLLGLAALAWFPDRPADARWLSDPQKRWLTENAARSEHSARRSDWTALSQPVVWLSALLWFCLLCGSYGIIFWLPQVVASLTTLDAVGIGTIGALPWLAAGVGMYVNATHSDRTGERFWHIGVPAMASGVAIFAASGLGTGPAAMIALLIGGLGLGAAQGAFWALPTRLLSRQALAMGVVTINVAGSAGGLVMPHLMGWARDSTGGFALPTGLVVAALIAAALLVATMRAMQGDEGGCVASSTRPAPAPRGR